MELRTSINRIVLNERFPRMYVCLCNGLTDSQIRGAIASGASRPKEVYAACGCNAQCGCCTGTMLTILRDQPAQSTQAASGN
ncbi:(2Fe-2S)-binding protein [Roseomonas sp. GC11]|uniref:(2Fe-2S)-binding protein n=1 Tax=Roseomonas sp. GC11 TaxID=2950546 RepID=UPI00210B46A0|nr:(2Fe-2S)-binding protein [Roseomonas sp. GC11]MCQ4161899.1 (2Fe-2S)-binding protein [Roseomonas sp. GC11]